MISITEPNDTFGQADLKKCWMYVLRLKFHDITETEEAHTMFDATMARQIIDFVEIAERNPRCEGILVHCRAGISRSAAVAKCIAGHYKLPFDTKYALYNRLVYRELRHEFRREVIIRQ